MTKQELLTNIRSARSQLEGVLAPLTPDEMETSVLDNGWSIKDLLAHFGFWEGRAADLFHLLKSGQTPVAYNENLDEINAGAYAVHHDKPLGDVLAWEQQQYRALLSTAESATEMELFNPHRFSWLGGRGFFEVFEDNSSGHYTEHMPALQTWLQSRHA
jgi:hypothetical protein